jgi:serine/threonine-protein phosphatase 2B catalytic subunit
VFRGHQVKQDGFQMHKWGNKDSFPYVITIFSAPNYCGSYKNKASVLILKNNNLQLKQYQDTEPPYHLPDGLDLFSWSLPFLAEKITSMLYSILRQCNDAELKGIEEEGEETQKVLQDESSKEAAKLKRKLVLKNKISSVGKMAKMLSNLREN